MARNTTVGEYVSALPEGQLAVTDRLLPAIEAALPGTGAIWHGHPVGSLGARPGASPVCYPKGHRSRLSFGLWRGQEAADPSGRLEPGARAMAQVRLSSPEEVDAELYTDWLAQARRLEG
ncbi:MULTISPECIES: DUF1801 domain-containing protein [unclassified Nocardiopsis]|uniref:DUF1801 domain-containing protein n=1 Tax=unclassified Nocardiopsis TaxID=2649073 RepID=UPI001359FD0E|nr:MULTISPECIES: DUF1801 domain-containing protein [unclassified Nocardiopsis]